MRNIGIIGCGLMGSGIAGNYLKNKDTVYVYDINASAVEALREKGAKAAASIQELAGVSDFVILSLASPELIRTIVSGEAGLIDHMKPGSFILDMSTNDVAYTREVHEAAAAEDIHFFDCPLSGGPDGAVRGELTVMAGGDAVQFEAVKPVLDVIGKNIQYVGESGSGQVAKLCNNMVVAGIISLIGEAFAVGRENGVDERTLSGIFQNGSAASKVMDVFGVNMLDESYDNVKFSLDNLKKDTGLYKKLKDSGSVGDALSDEVNNLVENCARQGFGDMDSSVIHHIIKKTF